jgi:hypothetical protein
MNKYVFLLAFLSFGIHSRAQKIDFDKRIKELGIELYPPTKAMGTYVKVVRAGVRAIFYTLLVMVRRGQITAILLARWGKI